MRYYIIAGEVSGDLHASFLMQEIKRDDPGAEFRFWGGDLMKKQGGEIVKHIKDLAFMGFVEVLFNLKTIINNLKLCKKDIIEYNPDAVVLVDYPGFNLRIAKFSKRKGFPTFYYISPKVWAWKKGRIKTMRRVLTKLFVIFPFEEEFFQRNNLKADYVGNPLLDEIYQYRKENDKEEFLRVNNLGGKPIIALLPGSREQEIKSLLPLQTSLVDKFPEFDFVVAGVSSHSKDFYYKYILSNKAKLIFDKTYSILNVSHAAVVCSGTATLETALFNIPEVVCYKANPISFAIGKLLVNLDYISLVNIILNKMAVVELLQKDWNWEDLHKEFKKIAFDEQYRVQMQMEFSNLRTMLGNAGASRIVAKKIINEIEKK